MRSRAYFVSSSPKSSLRVRARFKRRCLMDAEMFVTVLLKKEIPYRAALRLPPDKPSPPSKAHPWTPSSRETFSEGLDCKFRPDLGPKLEAVDDGLGWSVNPNSAAFDGIFRDAESKRLT